MTKIFTRRRARPLLCCQRPKMFQCLACDLVVSGTTDSVAFDAAVLHATSAHQADDYPETLIAGRLGRQVFREI